MGYTPVKLDIAPKPLFVDNGGDKTPPYNPSKLDMSGVPEKSTKTYQVSTFDDGSVKAVKVLKPIYVSDADILKVNPQLTSTEVVWVKSIINSIDPNTYRDSVINLGVNYQEESTNLIQKYGGVGNVNTAMITESLSEVCNIISNIPFKKKLFGPSLNEYFGSARIKINDIDHNIQSLMPCVRDSIRILESIESEFEVALQGLNMACESIIVIMNMVDESYKDLLLNRINNLRTSHAVAYQSKQIINLKRSNYTNIINTVNNTLHTAIPTLWNQIELFEVNHIDVTVDTLIESKNSIVSLLSKKSS